MFRKQSFLLNNRGFILIELIIVLAIMAVLSGAVAFATISYVRKAKETAAIVTCRNIVQTASAQLVEYSLENAASVSDIAEALNAQQDSLLEEAGAKGQLTEDIVVSTGPVISRLIFQTTGGIIVTYIRGGSPEYTIGEKEGAFSGTDAPSYLASFLQLLENSDVSLDTLKELFPYSQYPDLYYNNGTTFKLNDTSTTKNCSSTFNT